jgi:hypothetical protein
VCAPQGTGARALPRGVFHVIVLPHQGMGAFVQPSRRLRSSATRVLACAMLVSWVGSGVFAAEANAQSAIIPDNPQLATSYVRPQSPFSPFVPIYNGLMKRHVLEDLKQFFAPLRLPRTLVVQVSECGGATTKTYKPGGPVTICYELVDQIGKAAAEMAPNDQGQQDQIVNGAFVQAMLVELSHAIFDLLQVPIWGRESDAADRLAAFIMLQFGEDTAKTAIFNSAQLFLHTALTPDRIWTGTDFAKATSPEAQRMYEYMCIAVGGDEPSFGWVYNYMPKFRAGSCAEDYAKIEGAFNLRIMPYMDPNLLVQVRARRWLQ